MHLRDLPSVDELARASDDPLAVEAARTVLDRARDEIRAGADPGDLAGRLRDELAALRTPQLRRVVNATGVLVHTNLGRAPLADEALDRVVAAGRGYSNLEYDLTTGTRGSRQDHVARILRRLTGAEGALVVNNNAAAVMLALAALAEGREVLVSRGELIEIGDGFRIPDVLVRSGARLREVGTTNRTRASDYERAIGAETAVLLRVHQSNFRVVGFTEQPTVRELAQVADSHNLPLVDDLGSGVLVELPGEPSAKEALAAGADLVTFSGDKLLGGPQAGVVVGRADLVEQLRRHPLQRALRADKLTLAALEGTLALYLDVPERIPVLRMLRETEAAVRARASRLATLVDGTVEETVARVGGGARAARTSCRSRRWRDRSRPTSTRRSGSPSSGCSARRKARCGRARRAWRRSLTARSRRRSRVSAAARCRSRRSPASPVPSRRRSRRRCAPATHPSSASSGTDACCSTAARWRTPRWTRWPRPSAPRGRDRRGAMPLTVGTAGHIDHGKTWLVRALTGKDTDRLPEERARGISIDLGYAPLLLPDGRRLSLIDVPGHERFVRNMVAGATGIDLFLLVVDANEGARPQTHEHLAILRLLGIDRGVVALTKTDAVDAETLELAFEEVRELVPGAPVVATSAKTGVGLDELRGELARIAVEREAVDGPTRLYVDRVFSLRGIGTVVTGTLWSGALAEGDELRAEPAGVEVRVRSVQVHDEPVEVAAAGQRVAVALPGIDRNRLRRGDALLEPGAYPSSYRLDVALSELEPIPDGARVTVHHGTSHTVGRVVRAGARYAQLRLAEPVVAARGDRVVLRQRTTIGGGIVLDPAPARSVDTSRLELLEHGDPEAIVRAVVYGPVTGRELQARAVLPPAELARGLAAVRSAGDWYFAQEWLDELADRVRARLREHASRQPLDPGLPIAQLLLNRPWSGAVAPLLGLERRAGKLYLPGTAPTLAGREEEAARLDAELADQGVAKVEDRELGTFLEQAGRLKRLGDGFAASPALYERGLEVVRSLTPITLAGFRDALGVSRRHAQLLLERYDADGFTRRVGDERVLRKAGREAAQS